MPETLISLLDATLSRGGRDLVSGVSLRVQAGDIVWVRGPNGSGKSTLLRALAGLMPLAAGRLEGAGLEAIAYIGHRSGLDSRARVRGEAAFWLGTTDGVADHLGIADLDQRVGQLSAGQRRKLEVLRLRAARRPVWILDEPFASLDTAASADLAALVARHTAQGGAAIIASHQGLPEFGREVRVLTIGTPVVTAA